MALKMYTIGHSTRELAELVTILRHYEVDCLVDVRTMPRSRRVPQFNQENLSAELPKAGIDYAHLALLGGLRPTHKDSINTGWRNKSFRGYADYMQTKEFAEGLSELLELIESKVVAIMCAEVLPWRCHRSLIGDALLVRGVEVWDIFDLHTVKLEKLTSFAVVEGERVYYPAIAGGEAGEEDEKSPRK